ncbi:DUF5304 domain-containing protein [Streptomyces sp. NBC_00670]|jgi:hypothetical protein|uniref:DUF5304 domain-containing protein n=1 Tax=Streptomyces sp. NBC_00670 TaxID=2975804 RepID=UPI002E362BFC|nr:DUF5304 domain-containing protein [Streptomyces sp. NBC_00670]
MSEERRHSDEADEAAFDAAREAAEADREANREPDRPQATDADAWATATAEDLAEEQARRKAQYGAPSGSAAEELRRFVDTVADRLTGLQSPLFGAAASGAAQQMVDQVVRQARAVVEPVIERNPDVFDHLAAAGTELLAAYRSAVQAQEGRWTARDQGTDPRKDDEGPGPGEHIDVD